MPWQLVSSLWDSAAAQLQLGMKAVLALSHSPYFCEAALGRVAASLVLEGNHPSVYSLYMSSVSSSKQSVSDAVILKPLSPFLRCWKCNRRNKNGKRARETSGQCVSGPRWLIQHFHAAGIMACHNNRRIPLHVRGRKISPAISLQHNQSNEIHIYSVKVPKALKMLQFLIL